MAHLHIHELLMVLSQVMSEFQLFQLRYNLAWDCLSLWVSSFLLLFVFVPQVVVAHAINSNHLYVYDLNVHLRASLMLVLDVLRNKCHSLIKTASI